MILKQDPETGYWNEGLTNTHIPEDCNGRLCDIHNRRGEGAHTKWPLNYRADRGMMEVICPCGIGHPSPAQVLYWEEIGASESEQVHGCCVEHCPIL